MRRRGSATKIEDIMLWGDFFSSCLLFVFVLGGQGKHTKVSEIHSGTNDVGGEQSGHSNF